MARLSLSVICGQYLIAEIASIFTRISEVPEQQYSSALDFTSAYKVCLQHLFVTCTSLILRQKYTVYRKMPMLVVRHERILAMDGDYIHVRFAAFYCMYNLTYSPQIMPSATRAFLDSMKTSSYHIKTVIACVQSAKSSSNFKLVVWRDGGNKRYDFEAESPKIAGGYPSRFRLGDTNLHLFKPKSYGTLKTSKQSAWSAREH